MPIGTCKFWRADKGYGFLAIEDGPDVFVHASQIRPAGYAALTEGQKVKFEIGSNAKTGQPMAVNLQLLEPIISPKSMPTSFHADDTRDVHRQLAETAFLKAPR